MWRRAQGRLALRSVAAKPIQPGEEPRLGNLVEGLFTIAVLMVGTLSYLYVSYSRIIEARLHGERDRAVPRVYARPLSLQSGQSLTQSELVARLNDVGYAQRARVERTGEFAAVCEEAGIVVRPFAGEGARVSIGEREANDIFLMVAKEFAAR